MEEHGPSTADGWLRKAEEALQKATEAVGEAWKSTEDVRGQAWETAKRAANQAAEALDQGLDAARQTWQHADESADATPPQGEGGPAASHADAADEAVDTGMTDDEDGEPQG